MIITPCTNAKAKTLGQLKKELSVLESKYNENKNKKNLTTSQINNLKTEITNISSNIENIKSDISTTEKEIEKNQEEIEAKSKETDELLKFLQVSSGENVYLEYLFEADSYTDFIYRYSVVSQLTEYNNNLMEELKTLVTSLEQKKKDLSAKRSRLETESAELSSKMAVLQNNLSTYQEEGTTIEQDIKDMRSKIKQYQDLGCSDNEDILTCGVKKNPGVSINATGWNYPLVSGCVTSEYTSGIRTDWSGGGRHLGIDLSCISEGTTVYAAATGVVARVVYHSHCGGNMVYVHHSVNGVPYTTVYMHLLRISASENQVVTPSTKIGEVGGYSYGYDNCTGGVHLHFGMAYGNNAYNFNNNAFNPRNIYSFPALIYEGGGYFRR